MFVPDDDAGVPSIGRRLESIPVEVYFIEEVLLVDEFYKIESMIMFYKHDDNYLDHN